MNKDAFCPILSLESLYSKSRNRKSESRNWNPSTLVDRRNNLELCRLKIHDSELMFKITLLKNLEDLIQIIILS